MRSGLRRRADVTPEVGHAHREQAEDAWVEPKRLEHVAMRQRKKGPRRAATGARVAGRHVKGALGEERMLRGIEKK